MTIMRLSSALVPNELADNEGSAMDIADKTLTVTFFCPICGIDLARSDFDKALCDYNCPYCCSRQKPSQVNGRVGWEFPY